MRLLLIGCTGFVGRKLVSQLLSNGHHLTLISRKTEKEFPLITTSENLVRLQLNPANPKSWEQSPLKTALKNSEGIINLAGEPIAEQRWTPTHCLEIQNSRLATTKALVNAMAELRRPPRVLVNASAIGYYGTSPDATFNEQSPCGNDFLSKLCQKWEAEAIKKPKSTRLIIFRIGIVLGPDGGALGKMLPIFKAGLGGPIGGGEQWMSWVHRTDLSEMIQQALTNKQWSGVVNAVAPQPVSMNNFAAALGKSLGRPSLLSVPGPILKLLLGDGARVVLEGQKVESRRLKNLGFQFKYLELNQALNEITKGT
tara:strand:- start:3444 stop:4379 length:936 start_codon:yes stop_codon:yes gene_type:complete